MYVIRHICVGKYNNKLFSAKRWGMGSWVHVHYSEAIADVCIAVCTNARTSWKGNFTCVYAWFVFIAAKEREGCSAVRII